MLGKVAIFERTDVFRDELAARGHHVVYRASETNRCPGCGRAQWYVGRVTAECVFCGTAIVLAETEMSASGKQQGHGHSLHLGATPWDDRRQHKRMNAKGRMLQLLLDGSPHSFALENLSEGGAMGHDPIGLSPDTPLQVRLEDGTLVGATVRWVEGDLIGIAFDDAD
jgi:PilZ domain-containing protein